MPGQQPGDLHELPGSLQGVGYLLPPDPPV